MHHWRCWCNVGAMFVVFMTLARLFFDVGVLAGQCYTVRWLNGNENEINNLGSPERGTFNNRFTVFWIAYFFLLR